VCGIAGFFANHVEMPEKLLGAMLAEIRHRGPDSVGTLMENGLAMGVRRLAIIDLESGDQPIHNEDKSVSIVFNGEIYNFRELRQGLIARGHRFSTQSDTEVIVHLYEEYGEETPSLLNGMFAFCLFDRRKQILFLARDRAGKKPLYYYLRNGQFVFGSELKALVRFPSISREINPEAVVKYFAYGYVPAPGSIVQHVKKLPAGHWVTVDLEKVSLHMQCYWDFNYLQKCEAPEDELIQRLEEKLYAAVEKRLIADVPLGVFLSGGVDSGLVVALMSRFLDAQKIKSFTIGFTEKRFDESEYAEAVAKHYKTDHSVEILEADQAFNLLEEIVDKLDEPLADSSLIATYLVSRFARQSGIIVALSGDGGDEMFGGYPKYYIHRYARLYDAIPPLVREAIIDPIFHMVPLKEENNIFNYKVKRFLANARYLPHHRNQFWVSPFVPEELNQLLTFQGDSQDKIVFEDADILIERFRGSDLLDKMMYLDAKLILHNMYLAKVDRASMAASLEVRSPLLDKDIMEFSATIPSHYKVKGRNTKHLLKKVAERHLPAEVIYRFKKGFGIPLAFWLRKLSGEILALLEQRSTNLINKAFVEKLIREHVEGECDHSAKIWSVYLFLRWYDKVIS